MAKWFFRLPPDNEELIAAKNYKPEALISIEIDEKLRLAGINPPPPLDFLHNMCKSSEAKAALMSSEELKEQVDEVYRKLGIPRN